jgi:signal transduction histidine kinase
MVLLVALGAITVFASASVQRLTDFMWYRFRDVQTAGDARYEAEAARAALLRFESLTNLELATPSAEVESASSVERARVYRSLDALRTVVAPSVRPTLEKVAGDIDAYFTAQQHDEVSRRTGNNTPRLMPIVEPIVASLGDIGDAERQVQTAESKLVWRWCKAGDVAALIVFFASIAAIAASAFVIRPLLRLVEAMKRFAAGDREIRVAPAHGDIARTASAFNEMADTITGQHARMLTFLDEVSSELRRPLQLIRVAVSEVTPPKAALPAGTVGSRLSVIAHEVASLDQVISSFLDTSRIEWRKLDLQLGRLDLARMVADVVQVYASYSERHQILLAAPEKPVWIICDRDRIVQVLHALMANAVHVAPAGGVVDVRLVSEANEVVLSVVQPGAKLAKEDLAKMFAPFRIAAGPAPNEPQVGPGSRVPLSVAQRIAEAHGGSLVAESEEAATFRLRLPRAKEQPVGAPGAPVPTPAGGGKTAGAHG